MTSINCWGRRPRSPNVGVPPLGGPAERAPSTPTPKTTPKVAGRPAASRRATPIAATRAISSRLRSATPFGAAAGTRGGAPAQIIMISNPKPIQISFFFAPEGGPPVSRRDLLRFAHFAPRHPSGVALRGPLNWLEIKTGSRATSSLKTGASPPPPPPQLYGSHKIAAPPPLRGEGEGPQPENTEFKALLCIC